MRFDGAQFALGGVGAVALVVFLACMIAMVASHDKKDRDTASGCAAAVGFLVALMVILALLTAVSNRRYHDFSDDLHGYDVVYHGTRHNDRLVLRVGRCEMRFVVDNHGHPAIYRDGKDLVLSPAEVRALATRIPGCER